MVEQSSGTGAGARSNRGRPLRGIAEIRHFFRTNTTPVFFVGATPFNLLGLDRWVRNFDYITYYDAWDGQHPRVFTPKDKPYIEFESGEEINNYLLTHPEVREYMQRGVSDGMRPKVAMVFFDEETEKICTDLGYDLILPSAALREHLDSKIVTTRLGDEAGAPSVPNILTSVDSWEELVEQTTAAGLGTDVVLQTPYGDSGKTTFFLTSEADWDKSKDDIVGQQQKIMKRINNRGIAVEAVLTRHGTVVGPFMTELIGHPELTPYKGGWCGNEMYPGRAVRRGTGEGQPAGPPARRPAGRRGVPGLLRGRRADRHRRRRGVSRRAQPADQRRVVDHQRDRRRVLGHPAVPVPPARVHGRRVRARRRRDQPPLGGSRVRRPVEPDDHQGDRLVRRAHHRGRDDRPVVLRRRRPAAFRRAALDWHQLQNENECFFLRIYGPGDYRWKGADLGVLVTKGRLQTEEPETGAGSGAPTAAAPVPDASEPAPSAPDLISSSESDVAPENLPDEPDPVKPGGKPRITPRGLRLIDAIRAQYRGVPLEPEMPAPVTGVGIKSGW